MAGPKLNILKTEGILIGSSKSEIPPKSDISWKSTIKYLGVFVGHDKEFAYKKNWLNKLDQLQKLLDVWRIRNLTIFGKVIILKSFAIPKFIYTATMLNLPTEILKKVEKLCFGFIWNSNEKIKRNTLIGPIVEGGISMIDLELQVKSLMAAWIPRILKSQDKPWTIYAQYYIYVNMVLIIW